MRVRMRPLVLIAVAGVTCVGLADAETLHEKVAVGAMRCQNGVCWPDGRPQAGASAIEQDGELLPAPGGGPQPLPGEPVFSPQPERVEAGNEAGARPPGDFPPERRDVVRPDRETGPEGPGKRTYHEVFNPVIFPYK